MGVTAGTKVNLEYDSSTAKLEISISLQKPIIKITDWEWPVISYPGTEKLDFDVKEFIREGYEERGRKIMGLKD